MAIQLSLSALRCRQLPPPCAGAHGPLPALFQAPRTTRACARAAPPSSPTSEPAVRVGDADEPGAGGCAGRLRPAHPPAPGCIGSGNPNRRRVLGSVLFVVRVGGFWVYGFDTFLAHAPMRCATRKITRAQRAPHHICGRQARLSIFLRRSD